MQRGSSFKAQYRHASARAATPPRPAWEPLSPALTATDPTAHPAASSPYGASPSNRHSNRGALSTPAAGDIAHTSLQLSPPPVRHDQPLRSAPLPQPHPPYSLHLGSPINNLAGGLNAPQRTSPVYADAVRRASYATTSPPIARHDAQERAPQYALSRDKVYHHSERPSKRARSELHTTPQYGQQHSRPATSHIPGWSYNVEHMADTGMRLYQDNQGSVPPRGESGDKRLSDAELLLFFSNVSAHTAQTPPSTAKRTSISQQLHADPPLQQNQQTHEPTSPNSTAILPFGHHELPTQTPPELKHTPAAPSHLSERIDTAPMSKLSTPLEEVASSVPTMLNSEITSAADTKPKKHQGWPKGKARGARGTSAIGKKKRSTPKPKGASVVGAAAAADPLQSPMSLTVDHGASTITEVEPSSIQRLEGSPSLRRHSFAMPVVHRSLDLPVAASNRAHSAPLGIEQAPAGPAELCQPEKRASVEVPDLICAACKSSESEVKVGDGEQWIGCDGCKEWYHYACAGFNSEREVRDVNKFYCDPCRPKFGETTKVRKSVRVHTTVDYAGLNEGVLKTSDDNPEHHYISAFKNGDIEFAPETFARMPPELVSSDFLEKTNGFKEPILIPGALNPRPYISTTEVAEESCPEDQLELHNAHFEYETIIDDGQDKLDMVIPRGLTVRRVAELYGPNEPVPVIDVKAQEGEGKKWTMGKWADYYEQQGEKPVRNVISLEVSRSRLGRLIRRPKAVRDMDLQDSVWREDDKSPPPPVQFYCLMSVADCFTDFHIDFGGSSVYYHIVKGRKVFFFIPPTKQNLKKYEEWCLSPDQGHDWLGKQVKECYRVDLYPGDTMLIPSGWIHAVWTPEDSLVIGGNFLTRIHYGMQIRVLEIEKNTKVALQFRYPFFQKIMWLTAIKYLEEDPVPEPVEQLLQSGEQFKRSKPVYCEPDRFGHNSYLGPVNYNRRYYSKHELGGLTDLLTYLWRTVLISLGKIEVPQKTRAAVMKSIPKGLGEPLVLARRFAIWVAWKRGNETVPPWAMADAGLSDIMEGSEKKISTAQMKKLEKEPANDASRAPNAERSSARTRGSGSTPPQPLPTTVAHFNTMDHSVPLEGGPTGGGSMTGFLRPSANNPHITTPKTSQLGPKRVACDACRKRRIRCKHKDELIDTSKPGMHTIDLSGSYGISVKRRLSDHSIADAQTNAASGPLNGGPIMADVNGDPYALKSGRVKACADCRKSKRRCIHDEYGNVDPVKANEVPIPRGSASKKRRISDDDHATTPKRLKHESNYEDDYLHADMHHRHPLPGQLSIGSSLLQDIAFSAQQALDHSGDDEFVPVDPALQAYGNSAYPRLGVNQSYGNNVDSIMSSIEEHANGDYLMDSIEFTKHPSIEPLTPGSPTAQMDPTLAHTNGFMDMSAMCSEPVRHPSSPVSPSDDAGVNHALAHSTSNGQFKPASAVGLQPPTTPNSSGQRVPRLPTSTGSRSGRTNNRTSKTPKFTTNNKRADGQEGIKMEIGLGVTNGMGMLGMDAIDPSLDQASIELIKQLQQEEHGLRRRSR